MRRFLSHLATRARAHPFALALAATLVLGTGLNGARQLVDETLGGSDFGSSTFGGATPPAGLEEAIRGVFPTERCTDAQEAELALRDQLDAFGVSSWEIVRGAGIEGSTCVAVAMDAQMGRITLLMALDPGISDALAHVRERLYDECRSQEEAREMLSDALNEAGSSGWEIRMGRISYPTARRDEIRRHLDAGCWIYSGTGWTGDGTRLFWIGGK